jgi:hypothetical protein
MGTTGSLASGKYAYLKYCGHIAVMTGKIREAFNLNGVNTISELISKLDEKYPGFEEVFMPRGGVFNSRTAIICRRAGQVSFNIIAEDDGVKEGDTLTFW